MANGLGFQLLQNGLRRGLPMPTPYGFRTPVIPRVAPQADLLTMLGATPSPSVGGFVRGGDGVDSLARMGGGISSTPMTELVAGGNRWAQTTAQARAESAARMSNIDRLIEQLGAGGEPELEAEPVQEPEQEKPWGGYEFF